MHVAHSAQTQRAQPVTCTHQLSCVNKLSFMVMWQLMNVVRLSFMLNNHFIPRLHALLLRFHSLTTCSSLSLITTGWQWMENTTKVSGSAKCEKLACGHGHVKREYFKSAMDCRSRTQTIRSLTAACSHLLLSKSKVPFYNQPNLSKIHCDL